MELNNPLFIPVEGAKGVPVTGEMPATSGEVPEVKPEAVRESADAPKSDASAIPKPQPSSSGQLYLEPRDMIAAYPYVPERDPSTMTPEQLEAEPVNRALHATAVEEVTDFMNAAGRRFEERHSDWRHYENQLNELGPLTVALLQGSLQAGLDQPIDQVLDQILDRVCGLAKQLANRPDDVMTDLIDPGRVARNYKPLPPKRETDAEIADGILGTSSSPTYIP